MKPIDNHPCFWSCSYKGHTIAGAADGNNETITVILNTPSGYGAGVIHCRTLAGAKRAITKHIKSVSKN